MITRTVCGALIVILASSLVGCHSTGSVSQDTVSKERLGGESAEADNELIRLVEQFAGDVDGAASAWQRLSSYPSQQLTDRLSRIFRSLPENDYRRVLIAFVLCNLDYDYQTNREIVRSSLSKPPSYQHFYGDWPAALIQRLIEKGDRDLMSALLASADWADGSAATDLSGYFTKDFLRYPNDFLLRLGREPYAIRSKVYYLFTHDEMLTKEDIGQIRGHLQSLSQESELSLVANEMFRATSTFASRK